jgi:hypothetical protein
LVAQYGFYYFGIIKGIDGQAKTAATKISGIETPDDRTITFRLTNPAGDFLNRLAMPATGPSPGGRERPSRSCGATKLTRGSGTSYRSTPAIGPGISP